MPKEVKRSIEHRNIDKNGRMRVGQAGKAYCSLCDKDLVAGKSELVGHSKLSGHLRQSKTSQDSHQMRVFFTMTNASTIKAELNTVALLARKNIPFNMLDQPMERLCTTSPMIPNR